MHGLKVGALVAAIVSAYSNAASLVKEWMETKKERLLETTNENLQQSLTTGCLQVQTTYDADFARLGRVFAMGDGVSTCAFVIHMIQQRLTSYARQIVVEWTS